MSSWKRELGYHIKVFFHERGLNEWLLLLLRVVFSVEFVVKIVAEGAQPGNYFDSNWNVFDFVILLATLQPFVETDGMECVRALRLLKLFEAVNQHTAPQLAKVLAAFAAALDSLKYVGGV